MSSVFSTEALIDALRTDAASEDGGDMGGDIADARRAVRGTGLRLPATSPRRAHRSERYWRDVGTLDLSTRTWTCARWTCLRPLQPPLADPHHRVATTGEVRAATATSSPRGQQRRLQRCDRLGSSVRESVLSPAYWSVRARSGARSSWTAPNRDAFRARDPRQERGNRRRRRGQRRQRAGPRPRSSFRAASPSSAKDGEVSSSLYGCPNAAHGR
jgi:hypothetical protein